jgi:hypothetical protein
MSSVWRRAFGVGAAAEIDSPAARPGAPLAPMTELIGGGLYEIFCSITREVLGRKTKVCV